MIKISNEIKEAAKTASFVFLFYTVLAVSVTFFLVGCSWLYKFGITLAPNF